MDVGSSGNALDGLGVGEFPTFSMDNPDTALMFPGTSLCCLELLGTFGTGDTVFDRHAADDSNFFASSWSYHGTTNSQQSMWV